MQVTSKPSSFKLGSGLYDSIRSTIHVYLYGNYRDTKFKHQVSSTDIAGGELTYRRAYKDQFMYKSKTIKSKKRTILLT